MPNKNYYKQLENSLVLYDFLINKIGTNKEKFEKEIMPFLNQIEVQDFLQSPQTTKYYQYLTGLGLKIDPEFDKALVEYTLKIRQNPERENLSLKYYQYLSLLFTEIYLDLLTNDKKVLLEELNRFKKEKYENLSDFTEEDLKRLAYWMATGSGKTIVSHYNFLQIKKYFKDFNRIILITPNEGLSLQHVEELRKSGISADVYTGNKGVLTKDLDILVIDINKLRTENEKVAKKDEGKTIFVEEFGNNNILLVDEGHKGKKQEEGTWERRRNKLSENGFIFEYSATFGQVVNKDNLQTFAKSIIFNYSYKKFYQDGYGKDFKIFNIESKSNFSEEDKKLILTANLLSFYQQIKAYEDNQAKAVVYNIEKPLWAVLGSKVVENSKKDDDTLTDVLFFINFLKEVLENETFLKENIEKILSEQTGFKDRYGKDVFKGHFELIKNLTVDQIVREIYEKVFLDKGKLEIYTIKNSDGEIGLKVKDKYFAVVNVGDVRGLQKKINEKLGIEPKTDEFSPALFPQAKDPHSSINIVIGAKKFIEGWDSWRVSSMGLIRIGQGEGSQIIQLFGRCVRLKGKNYSLKREPEEVRQKERWLDILQTAFIFSIGADYLKTFLEIISQEVPEYKEIEIDTVLEKPQEWENKLITLETQDVAEDKNKVIKITYDSKIARKVKISLTAKLQEIKGLEEEQLLNLSKNIAGQIKYLKDFVNYQQIFKELIDYKILTFKNTVSFDMDLIKELVEKADYRLYSNKVFEIRTLEDVEKLNKLILTVAKEYIEKFLKEIQKYEKRKILSPSYLRKDSPNIIKSIKIKIPYEFYQNYKDEIDKLEENLKLKKSDETIPFIFINQHLYNPLPVEKKEGEDPIKTTPIKLNEGERRFIEELTDYLKTNSKKKVYLLRNLPKIGIGFYEEEGYYPDFVLWYVKGNTQHIAFIDPKGLRFADKKWNENFKIIFNVVKTKIYEKLINQQLKQKGIKTRVKLYGFFISTSQKADIYSSILSKTLDPNQLESLGIYFFDDYEKDSINLPIFKNVKNYEYLNKIFDRMESESELDEYSSYFVEEFEANRQYSIEEIIKNVKTFMEDELLKGFVLFLKMQHFDKYTLEDIMIGFTTFYIERQNLERYLEKVYEEMEDILLELGLSKSDIKPVISKVRSLTLSQVLVLFQILIKMVQISIKLSLREIVELIENLQSKELDYKTPDISITADSTER